MNEDSSLFKIITDEDIIILNCDRFEKVLQRMKNPTQQFPQIIHFVKKKIKEEAYQKLFSNIRLNHRKITDSINLRLDTLIDDCVNSILLMNSKSSTKLLLFCEDLKILNDTKKHILTWSISTSHSIPNTVMTRLFFLFSDIIIIFAQNFEFHENSINQLTEWKRIESASNLSQCVRSRVLIIISENTSRYTITLQTLKHQSKISEIFQSIREFHWNPKMSKASLYRKLKKIMLDLANQMLTIYCRIDCLFSVFHLKIFYHQTINHTIYYMNRSFDFVFASWYDNFVENEREQHLSNFLSEEFMLRIPDVHLSSVIIFSLLVDAYSSEMSHKFI